MILKHLLAELSSLLYQILDLFLCYKDSDPLTKLLEILDIAHTVADSNIQLKLVTRNMVILLVTKHEILTLLLTMWLPLIILREVTSKTSLNLPLLKISMIIWWLFFIKLIWIAIFFNKWLLHLLLPLHMLLILSLPLNSSQDLALFSFSDLDSGYRGNRSY